MAILNLMKEGVPRYHSILAIQANTPPNRLPMNSSLIWTQKYISACAQKANTNQEEKY